MKKKRIYLDHAATTSLDSRVKKAMDKFWDEDFGNPSSIYTEGRMAKKALEKARIEISNVINSGPNEIIFTSGGTEGNNLAIFGVVNQHKKGHIVTTKIEHPSVLNVCKFLETNGFEVTYLDVNKEGIVSPKKVKEALRSDTILVSIIYANNEIGTIQPVKEIAKVIRGFKKTQKKSAYPLFHIDACQAAGYLDLNVKKLGVDIMTINGSKIYGPKGAGFLFIERTVKLQPLMYGGKQEGKMRAGTENVPGIVGLTEALKISHKEKTREVKRLTNLRDYFIKKVLKEISETYLNGHDVKRLPNNVNISILGVEGESVVLYLDEAGISCSTGSACTSESLEPSHVIMALGKPHEYGHGSIRFSLGRKTTKKDIDQVLKDLIKTVKKLRLISAVNI